MARKTQIENTAVLENLHAAAPADYYELHYLKQPEHLGPWFPCCECYPTREAAQEKADALREGRHASIKIIPKVWG